MSVNEIVQKTQFAIQNRCREQLLYYLCTNRIINP